MGGGGGGGGHAEVVTETEEPRHPVPRTGSHGPVETGAGAVPVCQITGNIISISISIQLNIKTYFRYSGFADEERQVSSDVRVGELIVDVDIVVVVVVGELEGRIVVWQ